MLILILNILFCFKVHQKNDNNRCSSESTSQWIGQWLWGNPFMFCVLLGQITRCCANLLQDFPFSLASICTLSFISKLNARPILKVKVASLKSDPILVAINKRINANSNEASWASQWEAAAGDITCLIIWFLWNWLFHWITWRSCDKVSYYNLYSCIVKYSWFLHHCMYHLCIIFSHSLKRKRF